MTSYLSESGLREDGRRPYEIRQVSCKLCVLSHADGSAEFRLGATHVMASVFGPRHGSSKTARSNDEEATVTCRVQLCEFSQSEHRMASEFRKKDRMLADLIVETFQCAIIGTLYPKSSIDIGIEILTDDGGINVAAINATCLALINAGICMKDYVVACSAGFIVPVSALSSITSNSINKSTTKNLNKNKNKNKNNNNNNNNSSSNKYQGIVDLTLQERNNWKQNENIEGEICNGIVMVVMMPNSEEIVTIEMQSIIPLNQMEKLLSFAKKGIKSMHKQMTDAVKNHSFMLLERKGFIGS